MPELTSPHHLLSRAPLIAAASLIALALAGCATEVNPVRDLVVAAGVRGGEPRPAPDFVSRTRQGSPDYVPVGTDAPKRANRAKTAAEVSGAEAEMDKVRAATEARGAAAKSP